MEFFRDTNIDFLGKKWYFLAFSLVFSVAGLLSMLFWHGVPLSVDFRGGTLVYVKYASTPDPDKVRATLQSAGLHGFRIQSYGPPGNHELLVALDQKDTGGQVLDQGRNKIVEALESGAPAGKLDLNNASSSAISSYLLEKDPLHAGTDAEERYKAETQAILNYRNVTKGGVLAGIEELGGVTKPEVVAALREGFFLSGFGVRSVEIVGPQVGRQLQGQALRAVAFSLAGMLIYLGFRFEWIFGIAAVLTVFHDTLITVGAFSLTNKEISLTVIAAILTLIGYSNNDTIVIFDRIAENLKQLRREKLADVVNKSINQTLSRTILTAGLTFLTVLALYLFGGQVLHDFSFALVIGILIGTYSSIAVAAPILVAYQEWRAQKTGSGVVRAKARA